MAQIGGMAREQVFSCTVCGATQTKWSGRCDACGSWNTIVEDTPLATGPGKALKRVLRTQYAAHRPETSRS